MACFNPYDPTGSTTYAFFAPNLQPDRGGPVQLFLKDVPFILVFLGALVLVSIIISILIWVHWILIWRNFQGPPLQVYPRNLPQNVIPSSPIFKQRWIYINGVATGQAILHQNVKLLSQIFGTQIDPRPILGINNRTYGFLGDIVESILQRSFGSRTSETRLAVPILESYLRDNGIDRVILIAHSQGGILASHILDTLYTSIAGPNLRKIEVYTFANAALHFHNPRDSGTNTYVIQHIEHYCNEYDLVCSWGALSSTSTPNPQFQGTVFVSRGATGHLLNQFYLSRMFLRPSANVYLNERATVDPANARKYWVSRTGIDGPPGHMVKDISRLHKYRDGNTPFP